jgi:hypothetical protein
MGERSRVTDEEMVQTLRDSPWEREMRKAAAAVKIKCAVCGLAEANGGAYCGEFCQMLAELAEEERR